MNETPKIAIIIRAFNRGGAEVLIREMFANKKFNKTIADCDLIILDGKRIELLKDLKNVNYYIINIFSSSYLNLFCEYYKLYKLIKEKKYQLLHSHLPNAAILVRFLKLFLPRIKIVYSEHNIVDSYKKISFILNGLTYSKDDHTIFVSSEVEACVNRHKRPGFYNYKNGSVIVNGIDPDKFNSPHKFDLYKEDVLTVGTVVSFRKWKRLDRWIEVAESFKKNYPNVPVKFIIAGVGPEKKMIEKLISSKNLINCIELPGLIVDTVSVYSRLDIFLMTSEFEGLPVALLEAMSCSCIPVVSNVGGIKNLNFNDFGFKYETFNAEEISKVISEYYNDKKQIVIEGNKSRDFIVKNHSLNKQVEEYTRVYELSLHNKFFV